MRADCRSISIEYCNMWQGKLTCNWLRSCLGFCGTWSTLLWHWSTLLWTFFRQTFFWIKGAHVLTFRNILEFVPILFWFKLSCNWFEESKGAPSQISNMGCLLISLWLIFLCVVDGWYILDWNLLTSSIKSKVNLWEGMVSHTELFWIKFSRPWFFWMPELWFCDEDSPFSKVDGSVQSLEVTLLGA